MKNSEQEAGGAPEKELVELARRIREWQEQNIPTTAKMLKYYPQLGSDRQYSRLYSGDLAEVGSTVEKWLTQYRTVWTLIETLGSQRDAEDEIYDDLSTVVRVRRSLVEMFTETGISRFMLVDGDTGIGKTKTGKAQIMRFGSRILYVELSPVFGDNPFNFIALILDALGQKNPPTNPLERYKKVVAELNGTRRCLIIDELHHAGPRILNTIKTLINSTPGEFVGLAMPTLWARLEKAAYEEVRQLTGNRLWERIRLEQVSRADIGKFLSKKLPGLGDDQKQAVALLEQAARGRGNLAFVKRACVRAASQYDAQKITLEDFASVVSAEVSRR